MMMMRCMIGLAVLGVFLAVVSADAKPKPKDGGKKHKPAEPSMHETHFDDDGHHNPDYDHESILGSEEEAEEYKSLSPEEAKKRLGVLVDRMDKDHDGIVTKEELQAWILQSFSMLDQQEAKKRFKEHDEDANGTVTWEEFVKKMYGYTLAEVAEFEKDKTEDMASFVKMVQFDKKKFMTADQNQDNSLDDKEYSAFLHPHNHEHMAGVEIERTLDDMDKDKDGKLTFKEFRGDVDKDAEDDHEEEAAEKENFNEYDKNKDGILDKDEIKSWLMPGFDDTAKQEAEHLIKEADKDSDGKLSKDEIVEAHDLFVGSQATDYGKTLEDMHKDEL